MNVPNPTQSPPSQNTTNPSPSQPIAPSHPCIHATKFFHVKTDLNKSLKDYHPVIDVESKSFKPTPTIFKVTERDYRGRTVTVPLTPANLVDKYWTEEFVNTIVENSNNYRTIKKETKPHLSCWKRKSDSSPFTPQDIYRFLAIIYYIGICKLPSKRDYWTEHDLMPSHPIINQSGLSLHRFEFLWNNFHLNCEMNVDKEDDEEEGETGDDTLLSGH